MSEVHQADGSGIRSRQHLRRRGAELLGGGRARPELLDGDQGEGAGATSGDDVPVSEMRLSRVVCADGVATRRVLATRTELRREAGFPKSRNMKSMKGTKG